MYNEHIINLKTIQCIFSADLLYALLSLLGQLVNRTEFFTVQIKCHLKFNFLSF